MTDDKPGQGHASCGPIGQSTNLKSGVLYRACSILLMTLAEARIVIESWRRRYNTERPHGP